MIKYHYLTKNIIPEASNIVIVKGRGVVLWDISGKDYIDFSAQTLNLSLGQCYPDFTDTIIKQLNNYTFLSSRFVCEPFLKLAETLVNLAPKGLTKINLKLNNGSNANESAFKRVRKYHKKQTIASLYGSHLGETSETINANGKHFENRQYIGGSQKFVFFSPPHPNFISLDITFQEWTEYGIILV